MFDVRRMSFEVGMRDPQHPDPGDITLTRVLAALSDPIRLGLVRLLADGQERGWGELRAPVGKTTLSHHLKVLREAGITRTRQEGTRCFSSCAAQTSTPGSRT
ncbi:ArsR/SmtB family transcription factor [Streptomyces sp. NPDC006527]|uniref:ArsR/SmtB family transcription factor n=1 Tax=Streptomyces sp. NPDC006527 TaxID=3364749 RepID=UPI00368A78D5